jgi:hypothetical protein
VAVDHLTAFKSFEAALNWLDPFVSPPTDLGTDARMA